MRAVVYHGHGGWRPVMPGGAPTGTRNIEHAAPERPDPTWGLLYKAGGWSALLYVLLVLVPVVLVFAAPLPPTQGTALLEYIADHKVIYLTELACFVGLAVPALVVFSAVAVALKGVNSASRTSSSRMPSSRATATPASPLIPRLYPAWRASRAASRS